jgi:hypothetical protein
MTNTRLYYYKKSPALTAGFFFMDTNTIFSGEKWRDVVNLKRNVGYRAKGLVHGGIPI